jgi:FkbM family methyltransferase
MSVQLRHPHHIRARLARALRALEIVPGWGRLAARLVPPDPGLEFLVRNGELVFAGNLQSHLDRQLYLFGGYEEPLIRAFVALIPETRRNAILDVGANIGTHAMRFAQVFRQVLAFEPNPAVVRQLKQHLELNALGNVTVHEVGLADRDATLDFHLINRPNSGLGTFSTTQQYDCELMVVGQARVVRADDYLTPLLSGPVDAVKIDVRGVRA